ncbi:hypothetical protein [Treponema sp. Marseille-Q3903]|uniref:hypothetical protein n=1 Tax=Treponema sp. Marseille-Q3903 TaxID=2766703 RepID=UPI002105C5BA|nr:hypothetical protein [Treponema sp. Marseille-Q3903]
MTNLGRKNYDRKYVRTSFGKTHPAATVRTYCKETGSGIKVVFDVFKDEDFAIYSGILS